MDVEEKSIAEQRLEELLHALAELQSRWPAHSVKPDMHRQLENIEEEIEKLREQMKTSKI